MSQVYRFKFSAEHFGIELESTDPLFIDQKMRELINWSIQQSTSGPRLLKQGEPAYRPPTSETTEEAVASFDEQTSTEEEAAPAAPQKKATTSGRRGRPKGSTNKTKTKTKSKRGRKPGPKKAPTKTNAKATVKKEIEDIEEEIDPKRIVEVAKGGDHYRKIKKNILDKSNQLNRILLAFHYARATYGKTGFSSGTIEGITEAFGNGIRRSNIAAQIKSNSELFSADQKPRRGVTVKYSLTAKGRSKIEGMITN